MKKKIMLFNIILLTVTIISCQSYSNIKYSQLNLKKDKVFVDNERKIKKNNLNNLNFLIWNQKYVHYSDSGFIEIIINNKLDNELRNQKYHGGSNELKEIYYNFYDKWNNEMNYSYNVLFNLLIDYDKELLKENQKAWELSFNKSIDFDTNLFYSNSYASTWGGNLMESFVMINKVEKIKERTFELMEYIYLLTGEVNFYYE